MVLDAETVIAIAKGVRSTSTGSLVWPEDNEYMDQKSPDQSFQ